MIQVNLLPTNTNEAQLQKGERFGELEVVSEYTRCEGRGVEWLLLCTACGDHTVRPASALLYARREGHECSCMNCHKEWLRGRGVENSINRINLIRARHERSGEFYTYWQDEAETERLRELFEEEFGPILDPLESAAIELGDDFCMYLADPPMSAAISPAGAPKREEVHSMQWWEASSQDSRLRESFSNIQKYAHWPQDIEHLKRYAGRDRITDALLELGWACTRKDTVRVATDELARVMTGLLKYYVLSHKRKTQKAEEPAQRAAATSKQSLEEFIAEVNRGYESQIRQAEEAVAVNNDEDPWYLRAIQGWKTA